MQTINQIYQNITWINSLFDYKSPPQFILDPFTTIIQLSLLKYKPPFTKISIKENKITFSHPSPIQGITRWISGDTRTYIHYLYLPILYIAHLKTTQQQQQTITTKKLESSCKSKQIANLSDSTSCRLALDVINYFYPLAIQGLLQLKNTYAHLQNDLVINCLELYILMLSSDDQDNIAQRYQKINTTTKNNFQIFTNNWSTQNIHIIHQLFQELEQLTINHQQQKQIYIIEQYLDQLHPQIRDEPTTNLPP